MRSSYENNKKITFILKDRYSLYKDMMRYGQDLENMTVDYRPWSL